MTVSDRAPPNGLAPGAQADDDGRPGNDAGAGRSSLAELREHAGGLAGELRGSLRRLRLRAGELAVEIEWQPTVPRRSPGPGYPAGGDLPAAEPAPSDVDDERELVLVTSPMVGTFYRAPEPGAAPFVSVGDEVEPGQVVGIVEAMKLMNHIVAEAAGTVAEVRVADAAPVEFGEPLVALSPPPSGQPDR